MFILSLSIFVFSIACIVCVHLITQRGVCLTLRVEQTTATPAKIASITTMPSELRALIDAESEEHAREFLERKAQELYGVFNDWGRVGQELLQITGDEN